MPAEKPRVSIILPVYNEEECLPVLFERMKTWLAAQESFEPEVLFVDDHSTDGTPELLKQRCEAELGWRYLRLSANAGSHIAIFAGLEHAHGDCAAFLASDLQDPPELISEMVERWQAGAAVVWAVREKREGVPASEMLFANAFYWLMNRFSQIVVPPKGSDFALIDRRLIDALRQSLSASPYLMGEIARLGFAQESVTYTKAERPAGTTKWNLQRKLHLVADAFTGFSFVPMRVMSYVGLTASALGVLYAGIVILNKIVIGGPVDGWSSLMVVILLLGGIQMTMLGVLGEYLWRTLEEARRRPKYFVESAVNVDPPPDFDHGHDSIEVGR